MRLYRRRQVDGWALGKLGEHNSDARTSWRSKHRTGEGRGVTLEPEFCRYPQGQDGISNQESQNSNPIKYGKACRGEQTAVGSSVLPMPFSKPHRRAQSRSDTLSQRRCALLESLCRTAPNCLIRHGSLGGAIRYTTRGTQQAAGTLAAAAETWSFESPMRADRCALTLIHAKLRRLDKFQTPRLDGLPGRPVSGEPVECSPMLHFPHLHAARSRGMGAR